MPRRMKCGIWQRRILLHRLEENLIHWFRDRMALEGPDEGAPLPDQELKPGLFLRGNFLDFTKRNFGDAEIRIQDLLQGHIGVRPHGKA